MTLCLYYLSLALEFLASRLLSHTIRDMKSMKKLLLPLALALTILGAGVATAGTLYPGSKYNLSPKIEKIQSGEICTAPGKAPWGKRVVVLQVWAHPGAYSVRINGVKAKQPAYFERKGGNGRVILQGYVIRAIVPSNQTRFRVVSQGYAKTSTDNTLSKWSYDVKIDFSGYWGSKPLKWDGRSFGSNPGVCNFM